MVWDGEAAAAERARAAGTPELMGGLVGHLLPRKLPPVNGARAGVPGRRRAVQFRHPSHPLGRKHLHVGAAPRGAGLDAERRELLGAWLVGDWDNGRVGLVWDGERH